MTVYEPYAGVTCPVCGHVGAQDHGPYEGDLDLGGSIGTHPAIHLMTCNGCGKNYDAGPAWLTARVAREVHQAQTAQSSSRRPRWLRSVS